MDLGWPSPSRVEDAPVQQRSRDVEQLKSAIIAAVSHELKTPIASIKAYATTLRANPDAVSARRDEFLRIIEEEADRLTRAVDDLLLASRVQAGRTLDQRVAVALDDAIDAALGALVFDARAHPIVRRTADIVLFGDPELLRDLFLHLIGNAVKFSPAGAPIGIEAATDAQEVTVVVRDAGIGIAEEHLPHIFERFYRVEHELTAATGGAGLGLFIVQGLAHAHGGSISVSSRPANGSTFTLRLPLR